MKVRIITKGSIVDGKISVTDFTEWVTSDQLNIMDDNGLILQVKIGERHFVDITDKLEKDLVREENMIYVTELYLPTYA